MPTLTLDVPPSTVAKWNALTDDERQKQARAIVEAIDAFEVRSPGTIEVTKEGYIIETDDFPDFEDARADIEAALAEDDAGLSIPFEQFWEERRAYWKERGIDF